MSASTSPVKLNEERRKRAFLGSLPSDFLRPQSLNNSSTQADLDQQTAMALQNELGGGLTIMKHPPTSLKITVDQAQLVKNYGLVTKMDPYVRLRIGHNVYETHTDPSGGRTPRWHKDILCILHQGISNIYLEIYDECSFTTDELIAWANIPIPSSVLNGETHEEWYPLSGKQGEGREGKINLILSLVNTPFAMPPYAPILMLPKTGGSSVLNSPYGGNFGPASVYVQHPRPAEQPPAQLSETDLKQIQEMFPNMDADVVRSVYEMNRGNKDTTVNSLLQMCE